MCPIKLGPIGQRESTGKTAEEDGIDAGTFTEEFAGENGDHLISFYVNRCQFMPGILNASPIY